MFFDCDLESEMRRPDAYQDPKRGDAKYGIDFDTTIDDRDSVLFEKVAEANGDQFMAVKPWKGAVDHMVPTGWKANRADKEGPDAALELEYIYGYRCHDARNNLRYTEEGKIVYHAAGVGVVMNQ